MVMMDFDESLQTSVKDESLSHLSIPILLSTSKLVFKLGSMNRRAEYRESLSMC